MKGLDRAISFLLLIVMATMLFSGCTKKLSGTYASEDGLTLGFLSIDSNMEYTFKGSDFTLSYKIKSTENETSINIKGKYNIYEENGEQKIKFDVDDYTAFQFDTSYSFSEGKNDEGKKIIVIGGTEYTKK